MPFRIRNWKLAILAFLFIGIFSALGAWQVSRAQQKKILLATYEARTTQTSLSAKELIPTADLRFYSVTLEGSFDNAHTFLLDNKTFHGKVGYEVYTPFKLKDSNKAILVDRGFIPILKDRQEIPVIQVIEGQVRLEGMLNLPPTYLALGQMLEAAEQHWPLRVEFIDLVEMSKLLNYQIFSYIAGLSPTDPHAYPIERQIVIMSPERHMGYALQWFALALTLLILFVALNRAPRK